MAKARALGHWLLRISHKEAVRVEHPGFMDSKVRKAGPENPIFGITASALKTESGQD
jgi:hypothetical protein